MASSKFIVSAIKYRPGTFADVLAQEHITRTLQHSLKRGQIANAYLFSGPRGTGKTTTARILAKALNCENSQDGEPCNQCRSCQMIAQGTHPDVLEIDAASNTGVENIRELRENTRFTPSIGRYKIFIIDECHMLSTQANNALLKTLEEPPDHCRFIFATTELQKILPTILSRCQRYPFRRIPVQVIVEHLRSILNKQTEIQIADPSQLERILYLLARSSEGCLRDALFSLDQLLAFCSGNLDIGEVEEIMGAIQFDLLDRYVRALIQEDLTTLLSIIEDLTIHGKEISLFLSECLQFLRNLAVIKISPQNLELLDLPDEYRQHISETAALTSLEQILYITDQLWDAELRIRNSALGRFIMEMASIKAAKAGQAVKIGDLIQKLSSGGPTITISTPAPIHRSTSKSVQSPSSDTLPPAHVSKPESQKTIGTEIKPEALSEAKLGSSPVTSTSISQEIPLDVLEPPREMEEDTEEMDRLESVAPISSRPSPLSSGKPSGSLSAIWNQFLKELENQSPLLAGALENSIALDIADEILRVAIPSQNSFSIRTLERPNNQQLLTQLLRQSFGKSLILRCEASEKLNADLQQNPATSAAQTPTVSRQELIKKVEQNKIFSKLMEEMPGRIIEIKSLESKEIDPSQRK